MTGFTLDLQTHEALMTRTGVISDDGQPTRRGGLHTADTVINPTVVAGRDVASDLQVAGFPDGALRECG